MPVHPQRLLNKKEVARLTKIRDDKKKALDELLEKDRKITKKLIQQQMMVALKADFVKATKEYNTEFDGYFGGKDDKKSL